MSIFSGLAKILSGSEAELEKKQREGSLAQQIPRKLKIDRNLDDKIISTAKVKIYQFQIIIYIFVVFMMTINFSLKMAIREM